MVTTEVRNLLEQDRNTSNVELQLDSRPLQATSTASVILSPGVRFLVASNPPLDLSTRSSLNLLF